MQTEARFDPDRRPAYMPVGTPLTTVEQLHNLIQWVSEGRDALGGGTTRHVLHGWSVALGVVLRQSETRWERGIWIKPGPKPTARLLRDFVAGIQGSLDVWMQLDEHRRARGAL